MKTINNQLSDLDFLLSHLSEPLFPRTIYTHKKPYQFSVILIQEMSYYFENTDFIDCKINAFPSLKEGVRWAPNFIFIDLDLADFKSKRALDLTLKKILENIKDRLGSHPTVLWTGGGYHIYQPIRGIEFEHYRDFNKFSDSNLFNEFLRFSKRFLSNGKADKQNYPSLKSCLLRIPGSTNSKYNTKVKIIQKWNGYRPSITLLIGDFFAYLIDKRQRQLRNQNHSGYNIHTHTNTISWIEKLLETPIKDGRKYALWKILCPYLINVKKISYKESFNILENWLDRCDCFNKLSFNTTYEIQTKLRGVKSYLPISLSKLKIDNSYFFKILQDMKILES